MRIKEIKLKNFKSFRRAKIEFYDGFTTISGPNGSGKSNVVDGIIFTLGLSSSKIMRAGKLTDLIYNSNGTEPEFAEVSIKFDKSNKKISTENGEMSIKRTIRRTESGYYSNYYFNEKSCSLGDIHRHLSGVDIPPEGSNIILQGDVTRIFGMNPLERRKIIDEITGVAEFDEKKEKSFEELDAVKNKIDMVQILLSEVDTRLEQLKIEKNLAIRYTELKSEKDRLERLLIIIKIRNLEHELGKIEREIEEKQLKKDAISRGMSEKTSTIINLESDLKKINNRIVEEGEEKADKIKREIEELLGSISRINGILELSVAELKRMDLEGRKALLEMFKEYNRLRELSNKIKDETDIKNGLLPKIDKLKTELEGVNKDITSIDEKFGDSAKNLEKLNINLDIEKNNKNELLRRKDRILDALNRRVSDITQIEDEIKQKNSLKSELEIKKVDIGKIVDESSKRIKDLSNDLGDLYDKKNRVNGDIRGIEVKLQDLHGKYAKKVAIMNASEKIGRYSHSVSSVLEARDRGMLNGIYGTVAELCNVDEKYAVALEIAAGGRMQCLVVDNDENASHSLRYLKEKNVGRATFLPLSKMAEKRPTDGIKGEGIIGFAINLVDFDDRFGPAFWYVFRDTLVVNNLNTARKFMNRYRIVTLDGEIVERSGAMTGGSAKPRFLTSEKEINHLRDQISKYESEKNQLIQLSNTVDDHINTQKKDSFKIEGELNKNKLDLQSVNERLKRLGDDINHLETKLLDLKAGKESLSKEVHDLGEKIKNHDAKILEYLENIERYEKTLQDSKVQKLSQEANEIVVNIQKIESDVRDSVSSIKELSLERTYLLKGMDEIKNKTLDIEDKKAVLRAKINDKNKEKLDFTTELESKRELEKKFSAKLSEFRKKRDEKINEISILERKKAEDAGQYRRLDDLISALKITEKKTGSDLEELKTEIVPKGEGVEVESQKQEQNKICDLNAVGTGDGMDSFIDLDSPKNSPKNIRKEIYVIEREMGRFGPVNMRAIEEYDVVLERQNDIRTRKDTLWNERKEIISRIKKYEDLKKETFMEAFDIINSNFKNIFRELSDGFGELVLDKYDDPFAGGLSIKAQPAGKNIMRLEAMSGGEKSLTALSFLFALQRFKPAPFYALDEIDMFLDGVNVERVAKMIKKLSGDAQFIVVSLRKPMIEAAESTIGVVMQENNISSVTGLRLNEMA